jgi:hypothetical protein
VTTPVPKLIDKYNGKISQDKAKNAGTGVSGSNFPVVKTDFSALCIFKNDKPYENCQATFFFSRKEAKALVLLRRRLWLPSPRRSRPRGSGRVPPAKLVKSIFKNDKPYENCQATFFFSRKEAKALVLLRRRLWATQPRRSRPRGSGGVPPAKLVNPNEQPLICGRVSFQE